MAKPIMIQGTMSNVGKSLITAGLGRVFMQDGYRTAPFKSQNMALNSYITRDHLEMGRAQAMQAFACGIEPEVSMNPILLKPTTDMGSQVILNGEAAGNMRAMEYFRKKKDYIPVIKSAYEKLDREYDIIVIEGAGSPAELNLKQDDIVNMGMAELADAPVLLAGDIDRGGVFAQLIGTVLLLEKKEQERIKGLIVNKFRGDRALLEPGIEMLEERCKKRVLGVIPYLDIELEEEDSLAESLGRRGGGEDGKADIAVIRLPKISNFTDVQAIALEPMVSLRYVGRPEELKEPDLIILPGTKNTIADLSWLRESGLEAEILRRSQTGCLILGICGGYQMLGVHISDPAGSEGGGSIRGMGLLPVETEFVSEKERNRIYGSTGKLTGVFETLSHKKVSGYEIHMGRSVRTEQGGGDFLYLGEKTDGCFAGNVLGTYLHGIFDEEEFRHALVDLLLKRKGIFNKNKSEFNYKKYRETQYDRLADAVRESLDMEAVYRILEIEKS